MRGILFRDPELFVIEGIVLKNLTWLFTVLAFLELSRSDVTAGQKAIFIGTITDTECGPDHAPMREKGGMGQDDASCTLKCVEKGASFGFVDAARKTFYQLDDQERPKKFAGQKVKVQGRLKGDTIFVESIAPAK